MIAFSWAWQFDPSGPGGPIAYPVWERIVYWAFPCRYVNSWPIAYPPAGVFAEMSSTTSYWSRAFGPGTPIVDPSGDIRAPGMLCRCAHAKGSARSGSSART